jgi:PAS domain-containing protein
MSSIFACFDRCKARRAPQAQANQTEPQRAQTQSGRRVAFDYSAEKAAEVREMVVEIAGTTLISDDDIQEFAHVSYLKAELSYPQKEIAFRFLFRKINTELFREAHFLTFILDKSFTIVAATDKSIQKSGYRRVDLLGQHLQKLVISEAVTKLANQNISAVRLSIKTDVDAPFARGHRAIQAHLFWIQYESYYVTILNTQTVAEPLLLKLHEQYEDAILPIPTQEHVSNSKDVYYYEPEHAHPTKVVFKQVVLAMKGPVYQAGGAFCIACDKDLEVLAMNQKAINLFKYSPHRMFTRKLSLFLTSESIAKFTKYLENGADLFSKEKVVVCEDIQFVTQENEIIKAQFRVMKNEESYFMLIGDSVESVGKASPRKLARSYTSDCVSGFSLSLSDDRKSGDGEKKQEASLPVLQLPPPPLSPFFSPLPTPDGSTVVGSFTSQSGGSSFYSPPSSNRFSSLPRKPVLLQLD